MTITMLGLTLLALSLPAFATQVPPTQDWLAYFGIAPPEMFAGFAGGLVNVFVFRRTTGAAICGSLVVGTFTANYFGLLVNPYAGATGGHAGAFLVGLGGVGFCQAMINFIQQWRPGTLKGSDNAQPPV